MTQLLSPKKVARICARMGVDYQALLKAYDADQEKTPRPFDKAEIACLFEYFERKQSSAAFYKLRHVLGRHHSGGVLSAQQAYKRIDDFVTLRRYKLIQEPKEKAPEP